MALSENIYNVFHTGDSCHRSVSFAAEPLKLFKMEGLVVLQKPDPINNLSQVPLSEIPKVGGGGGEGNAAPNRQKYKQESVGTAKLGMEQCMLRLKPRSDVNNRKFGENDTSSCLLN